MQEAIPVAKAVTLVDNILAQVSLRRDEHRNVQDAMAVIKQATLVKEEVKK